MDQTSSFGGYVRQRRREMDLTQEELARRVGCAAITLRKIEADDLRASVQIAERLAMALAIPLDERAEFVRRARAVRLESSELPPVTPPPSLEEIGGADLTGRAIRGYALAERIGIGGMGSVYRAVQPNVEREVAIKIILPAFANHPDFIRRFEAEAQLVARLEHPHIVPLYDYWREPGVAYLVMRLLRGGNVQNLLKQGPLPMDTTAHLLEQICFALNAAHRIGVIHRDLKPANVLLDEDVNAYLADFGIAKNLGDPDFEHQTQANAMIGSPQYMSPEQIRSLSIRPQTDVYCLGIMLYEMLTGALPFAGPTPLDMIQQHISMPIPPLSARKSGLPAALDGVIRRATAKDPEQRYADVLSLFDDFRQALGRMVGAHPMAIAYEEEDTNIEISNPFKGLRAFSEADAENFFGRETLVQQLLARLGEGGDLNRFLGVIGPSGSGKSSVVRAGLIPALRRGGLPGSEHWFIVDMLPGKHPFEELEASLLRVAVNPPESLLSQLKDGNRGLLRAVHRILPADETVDLVLVIDQFEEVFTLVEDEAERALLLESIAAAVMDERSRLRVVITLRADFTDKPLRYVDFGEMMQRRFEFVLPLTADELERVIAGPTQRLGLRVEKGLVSTIIREAGNQPGTLPLLQYALSELFEKREGRTLTNKAYHEIGGVLGALGRRAEAIFANLNEAGQSAARQLFLRLVTLGEGTEDTRRRVLREELEKLTMDSGRQTMAKDQLSAVADLFGKARLLTFDRDPITRGATIEVAHEALLREWSRLLEWLSETRADIRLQRQLAAMVDEWQNADRDASFLLTGTRLEQFEGWSANTSVALTQDEKAYLNASIAERDRRESEERIRQQRELENARKLAETERQRAEEQTQSATELRKRSYYLTGAFAIALVLAIAATFLGRQAQNSSRLATSRELAAASINNLEVDPERSILLALKAVDTTHAVDQTVLPEAEDALHRAVLASRAQLILGPGEEQVVRAVFSPDGSEIATRAVSMVRVWDANTGKELFQIPITPPPVELRLRAARGWDNVVYSSDSSQLASIDPDSLDESFIWAKVFDARSGELIRQMKIPMTRDESVASDFTSDLGKVVVGSSQNVGKIWDIRTGKLLVSLQGNQTSVLAVSLSADEKRIVTTSSDGSAKIWDAETGQELMNLCCHHQPVYGAAFSPDGSRVATASGDQTAKIWDAHTGKELVTLLGLVDQVTNVAFSPDGKQVAGTSFDHTTMVWNAETGDQLYRLTGHTDVVQDARFSPDGKHIVTASNDGSGIVWDAESSHEMSEIAVAPIWRSSISQNGNRLATRESGSEFIVWDLAKRQPILRFTDPDAHQVDVMATLAISPEGKRTVYATANSIRVWDVASGKQVLNLAPANQDEQPSFVGVPSFSADGKRILGIFDYPQIPTGVERHAVIWDSMSGAQLVDFVVAKGNLIGGAIAISPDGTRLVVGDSSGAVQVLDVRNGERLSEEHNASFVVHVAISPDGKQYAAASLDGTAVIRDMATGKVLFPPLTQSATIYQLEYSLDGKYISTAGFDGVAKVWDANTGKELHTLQASSAQVRGAHFSADGTHLITTGMDGVIREYTLNIEELVELAKARLTRTWTTGECQQYLHVQTCPKS
jgi:WD40 repeat protein/transcriptional regulator with XRE-family HTH domain